MNNAGRAAGPYLSRYKNPDDDPRGPYILAAATSPFERPALRYEWHGKLPPEGRCWRYPKERALALDAEGRTVLSTRGMVSIKRYLSEARLRPEEDKPVPEMPRLEFIVRNAMGGIAEAIARNPGCMRQVEWRDLERALREVFEKLGFSTELTRASQDGGFDLRLRCFEGGKPRTFLVEIKHWEGSGKRPGSPILDALFEIVASHDDNTTGLLLSSTGFAASAVTGRTEIERQTVRLGGKDKIVSLCQNYVKIGSGVWTPATDLADMLLDGTL
jgi:hypothetical protein